MKKKVVIIGVISILLVLIIIISFLFSGGSPFNNEIEERNLDILSDKEIILVGEVFNLTLQNAPNDANITWILGDGTVLFGHSLSYRYEESDLYTIYVNATWNEGIGYGHSHMTVYNKNIYRERIEDGRTTNRPRSAGHGYPCSIDLPKSFNQPNITATLKISNAIGRFEVQILFEDYEEGIQKIILSEEFQPTYEDISRVYEFNGDDIPMLNKTYGFSVEIIIWSGYCSSWKETVNAEFRLSP